MNDYRPFLTSALVGSPPPNCQDWRCTDPPQCSQWTCVAYDKSVNALFSGPLSNSFSPPLTSAISLPLLTAAPQKFSSPFA